MRRFLLFLQFACVAVVQMVAQSSTNFGLGSTLTFSTDDDGAVGLFDGSTGPCYFSPERYTPDIAEEYEPTECGLRFKASHPITVKSYSFFSDYDGGTPITWELYGSADGGTTWDLLTREEENTTAAEDIYSFHTFELTNPSEKKYDEFVFTCYENYHRMYQWGLTELRVNRVECDVFGHKDELVYHAQSAASCNEVGYKRDCYECPNCGGFYENANGTKKVLQNPIILHTKHHFVNGACEHCGSNDNRLSAINIQGVDVRFADSPELWTLFAEGDARGKGLHTTDKMYEEDNYYYNRIELTSDRPFTLSLKAMLSKVNPEGDYPNWVRSGLIVDGTWTEYLAMKIGDEITEENHWDTVEDSTQVVPFTYDFTAGRHEIAFENTDFNRWENVPDPNVQLDLWDFKIAVACNHVDQPLELKEVKAANCAQPVRTVYECLNCHEVFEQQSDTPKQGKHEHLMHGRRGTEATCTDYGFVADCYYCPDCGICFFDEACTQELPDMLAIAPLGHDYADNVCTRCHELKDRRLTVMNLHGVKARLEQSEGADADFACRPADQEGAYTFTDSFGLQRTFPATALVSQGKHWDQSRTNLYLECDKPFQLSFKLNYSVESSEWNHYGKVMLVMIDGEEEVATDNAYGGEKTMEEPTYHTVTLQPGQHKLNLQYGFVFYEGSMPNRTDGDDYGYIYDIAACTHDGGITSQLIFEGDCISPSLTRRSCGHCEWCDTIPGELNPLVHPHELVAVAPVQSCMAKDVKQNYYYCPDCQQRFHDLAGTQPAGDAPLGDVLAHEWGADGKCVRCGQSHYYDGTSTMPQQITLAECDVYGLTPDYAGYYAITTASELYGYAAFLNKAAAHTLKAVMQDHVEPSPDSVAVLKSNAVLLADIPVNPSVLDGQQLRSDAQSLHRWTKIGPFEGNYMEDIYKVNGIFDGNGHTISGIYLTYDENDEDETNKIGVGLFGDCATTIRRLNLVDSYVKGTRYVGALVGLTKGTIEECQVQAVVEMSLDKGDAVGAWGLGDAGLITSQNQGSILNCYAKGTIRGPEDIGGICSRNYGDVINCLADVDIQCQDESSAGGIAYLKDAGSIANCFYVQHGTASGVPVVWEWEHPTEAVPVTPEMLASGEVAYNLGAGSHFTTSNYWSTTQHDYPGDSWGQQLGVDLQPQLCADAPKVYRGYAGCEIAEYVYSNTAMTTDHDGHVFDSQGICRNTAGELHYEPCQQDEEDGTLLIGNYGQLCYFMQQVYTVNSSLNARLTADIIVNDNLSESNTDTLFWHPVDDQQNVDLDHGFSGDFDGQGHTIQGLLAQEGTTDRIGFFSNLTGRARVHDLVLRGCTFVGKNYVGAVAGAVGLNASVERCAVIGCTSKLYSTEGMTANHIRTGGIAGSLYGRIVTCYTDATNLYGYIDTESGALATNSYWLSTGTPSTSTFVQADLASGALCYRLNGNTATPDAAWRQTLGCDPYPVVADTSRVVYYGVNDCTQQTVHSYSNLPLTDHATHLYANGQCQRCQAYEAAPMEREGTLVWYNVSNAGQLYWAANEAKNSTAANPFNIRICRDIKVNDNVLNNEGILNEGTFKAWKPIGTDANPFYGLIDGQGHTISGLYCDQPDHAALVAYIQGDNVKESGLRNLTLSDSYFAAATTSHAAAFAANATQNVRFYGLTNRSSVWATTQTAGGIVAEISGNSDCVVDSCSNQGWVYAKKQQSGGIVGLLQGPNVVRKSRNYGSVSIDAKTGQKVGGVVGNATEADGQQTQAISGCGNYGTVSGYKYVGGVVGDIYRNTTVQNSFNLGQATGKLTVSGVVGHAYSDKSTLKWSIQGCYNGGSVMVNGQPVAAQNTIVASKGGASNMANNYTLTEYATWYADVKDVIRKARRRAATPESDDEVEMEDVHDICLQQLGCGELCYMLNVAAGKQIFGQRIGVDMYPVVDGPRVYRSKTTGKYRNFVEGDVNDDGKYDVEDIHFMGRVLVGQETDDYDVSLEPGETELSISTITRRIAKMLKEE